MAPALQIRSASVRQSEVYGAGNFVRVAKERAFGGLSQAIQRQLSSITNGKPVQATSPKIKPGTRLLRERHGTTHEVMATDKGYVWNGTTYRSLTAIARSITGTQWNGPVFFGLKKKRGAKNG